MLRRKAYDKLLEWKSRDHKCLLVKGQRQVGKTYIIERFAKDNYKHVIRTNLAEDEKMRKVFDGNLDVDTIIRGMMLYRNPEDFVPGSTLIFLDEIQECPRARSALKAFSIDGRYDVIASGSLLGVVGMWQTDGKIPPLLPVGYEEHLTMYSLDFEEFLWARGITEESVNIVKNCIRERLPIDGAMLNAFSTAFRDYMIVGGMPAAVASFAQEKNYAAPGKIITEILETCKNDINRYNTKRESIKTIECFDSIPAQLAQSNKKFTYSRLSGEGARASAEKYMENLLWIKNAGYGNFCYGLRQPTHPVEGQVDRNSFKVYLSDTGMLSHMMGQNAIRAIYEGDTAYNMGAVVENVVAECLMKCGYPPRYYRKSSGPARMEIDFILKFYKDIVAVEVKSGKNRDAPSLWKIAEHFDIGRRIMFADSNISVDAEGIETYPLFAAAFADCLEPRWEMPQF
ncbi:MAG: ATP-binding protein [Thermoplasmatales archaeon]|nr:ATP-binding protein [Thermoplasmatales archaeon]